MGVGSWPTRRARAQRDRVAFTVGDRSITFAEVENDATRFAHGLSSLGVKKGDRVAYLGLNSAEFMKVFFATSKLGAVFVPLNTRLSRTEIQYILSDCEPVVLFWDEPFSELVAALELDLSATSSISIHWRDPGLNLEALSSLAAGVSGPLGVEIAQDDCLMIQYTSGTSGRPKGVMLTHGNVTWNTYNVLIDMDIVSSDVALVMAPMFHTASLNMQVLPLFVKGGRSVIEPRFDPGLALRLIEREGVTNFFGVATMFNELLEHEDWDTSDLATLAGLGTGGQAVPEHILRQLQEQRLHVTTGYGLTEASPGLTLLRGEDAMTKLGSAGGPHFFAEIRLVDLDGQIVAPGGTGEIQASGPNIMLGYFGQEDSTRASFTDDNWLKTGDLGRMDEDGYVTIVGRVKDMIISGGENVYPAEVEAAIYENSAVKEVAVVGISDEKWGEVGHAVVSLKAGAVLAEEELHEFLCARLARYKVPHKVTIIEELPHNAAGKIIRRELREKLNTRGVVD